MWAEAANACWRIATGAGAGFGLLGGFILYAAFMPSYQAIAMLIAGISMIGFAVLMQGVGSDNQAMLRVLYADYVGIFFLVIAVTVKYGLVD